MPDCQVRLETPFPDEEKNKRLDIWLPDMKIAMELKCKTQKLDVNPPGSEERFKLKPQDDRDTGRYGFIRDIRRLERHGRADAGFEVLLTNDPLYWEETSRKTGGQDEDFFLYDGRMIGGTMKRAVVKDLDAGGRRKREDRTRRLLQTRLEGLLEKYGEGEVRTISISRGKSAVLGDLTLDDFR